MVRVGDEEKAMTSLHCLQNSAVRRNTVWIICWTMFLPAVCYSDDQAKSKLLGSAIQKAIEESDKHEDNSKKNSSDNQSSRSSRSQDSQSYSSPSQDSYGSTNSYQQAPTENQWRETPSSRLMGNTIKDVMTSDYPNQPRPSTDNQWRETPSSRLIGNTIRDVMTSGYPDRENQSGRYHSNRGNNNYYYGYPYGSYYYQGPSECSVDNCYPNTEITRSNVKEITPKSPSSDSRRHPFSVRSFIERQLIRLRTLLAGRWPGATRLSQTISEAVENCDNADGTVNVTYEDADNDEKLSVGDRFVFRYRRCQDNALGIAADGQLKLRVTEVVGDVVNEISPYTFAGKFNFNQLNVINNSTHDRSMVKGDVDFRVSTNLELSRQKMPADR